MGLGCSLQARLAQSPTPPRPPSFLRALLLPLRLRCLRDKCAKRGHLSREEPSCTCTALVESGLSLAKPPRSPRLSVQLRPSCPSPTCVHSRSFAVPLRLRCLRALLLPLPNLRSFAFIRLSRCSSLSVDGQSSPTHARIIDRNIWDRKKQEPDQPSRLRPLLAPFFCPQCFCQFMCVHSPVPAQLPARRRAATQSGSDRSRCNHGRNTLHCTLTRLGPPDPAQGALSCIPAKG